LRRRRPTPVWGQTRSNSTGIANTASGIAALGNNTVRSFDTAIGFQADVSAGNLTNATAIGNGSIVNASNKVRLVNTAVTVISRVAESEVTTLPGNANQHSPFLRTRTAAPRYARAAQGAASMLRLPATIFV
jgi:hypothetical protein